MSHTLSHTFHSKSQRYNYLTKSIASICTKGHYLRQALYMLYIQAARGASAIYSAFVFRRILQKQETSPVLLRNMVPLCSRQYDRMFNTTRYLGDFCPSIMCKGLTTSSCRYVQGTRGREWHARPPGRLHSHRRHPQGQILQDGLLLQRPAAPTDGAANVTWMAST